MDYETCREGLRAVGVDPDSLPAVLEPRDLVELARSAGLTPLQTVCLLFKHDMEERFEFDPEYLFTDEWLVDYVPADDLLEGIRAVLRTADWDPAFCQAFTCAIRLERLYAYGIGGAEIRAFERRMYVLRGSGSEMEKENAVLYGQLTEAVSQLDVVVLDADREFLRQRRVESRWSAQFGDLEAQLEEVVSDERRDQRLLDLIPLRPGATRDELETEVAEEAAADRDRVRQMKARSARAKRMWAATHMDLDMGLPPGSMSSAASSLSSEDQDQLEQQRQQLRRRISRLCHPDSIGADNAFTPRQLQQLRDAFVSVHDDVDELTLKHPMSIERSVAALGRTLRSVEAVYRQVGVDSDPRLDVPEGLTGAELNAYFRGELLAIERLRLQVLMEAYGEEATDEIDRKASILAHPGRIESTKKAYLEEIAKHAAERHRLAAELDEQFGD